MKEYLKKSLTNKEMELIKGGTWVWDEKKKSQIWR